MTPLITFVVVYLLMGMTVLFRVSRSGVLTRRLRAAYPQAWQEFNGGFRLTMFTIMWPLVVQAIQGEE